MKIKDAYIGYTKPNGLQDFETFGGFQLMNEKPKQVEFTKAEVEIRIKELQSEDCIITTAEISTFEVENSIFAELIDPIKTETLI